MAHRNSIVVQCEVGADVNSMQDGVESMSLLTPEMLYLGGIRAADDLALPGCVPLSGYVVMLSSNTLDAKSLMDKAMASCHQRSQAALGALVRVDPGTPGKLSLQLGPQDELVR